MAKTPKKKTQTRSKNPHLSEISLQNFRGFKSAKSIPLRPLTFLVGPNSSGKSSLASAILLLAQSDLFEFAPNSPRWTGALVDLGSFDDVVHRHNKDGRIAIATTLTHPRYRPMEEGERPLSTIVFRFLFRCASKTDNTGTLSLAEITSPEMRGAISLKRKRGHHPTYVLDVGGNKIDIQEMLTSSARIRREVIELATESQSAEEINSYLAIMSALSSSELGLAQRVLSGRSPPQRWYERKAKTGSRRAFPQVFSSVDPAMLVGSARKNVAQSLAQLGFGNDVRPRDISQYHSLVRVVDNVTRTESNLIDVGYGVSQVLPVLLAVESITSAPLFVEQPEIHLHPGAQGEVAEVLVRASRERQVVVETHSEHIINRARQLVASGDIHHDDVVINYIQRSRSGSEVVPIFLDQDANFSRDWPRGFFDERLEATMELMRIRARKGKKSAHD